MTRRELINALESMPGATDDMEVFVSQPDPGNGDGFRLQPLTDARFARVSMGNLKNLHTFHFNGANALVFTD